MPDLSDMRRDYSAGEPLAATDLAPEWLADGWHVLLRKWIEDADAAGVVEPNAMVLATVDAAGHPAARTVLCKGVDESGVIFFTNRESDKGRQLQATPFAAITFAWPQIGRQVNLRGGVELVSAATTAAYWATRPRGSRLGAWASHQSQPIASRAGLDQALAAIEARFSGVDDIPVPPFWGGYRLIPGTAEFWQGRTSRLHNRIRATHGPQGWTIQRLQP